LNYPWRKNCRKNSHNFIAKAAMKYLVCTKKVSLNKDFNPFWEFFTGYEILLKIGIFYLIYNPTAWNRTCLVGSAYNCADCGWLVGRAGLQTERYDRLSWLGWELLLQQGGEGHSLQMLSVTYLAIASPAGRDVTCHKFTGSLLVFGPDHQLEQFYNRSRQPAQL
jgi:hypothetical protein